MKKVIMAGLLLLCVFVFYTIFSVRNYKPPELNTCLKASVSKKMLCKSAGDYVSLSEVSPYFLEAVVMSEDDKFYFHDGFDWKELRKSFMANFRAFSFVRGGSTITQQLVKNVYLNQDKSISRKIKEAYIASKVERKYSKKLILEKYINAIEFGKNIWGLNKASQFYFKNDQKI